MERLCPNCGAVLGAGVRYCMQCGTPITPAEPVHQPPMGSGAVPQLIDNYGQVFPLPRDVNSIGSDSANAIVVDDPGVGSLHAEIRAQESGWVLINLRGPADTRVNEQAISEPHVLSNDDVIDIGATRLRFVVPETAPAISQASVIAGASPVASAPVGMEQFRSSTDWLSQPDKTSVSAPPTQKRCKACGSLILAEAEICPKCGVRQIAAAPVVGKKSRTTAALLALFLGSFGAHKFYLGNIPLGVLYLIFCWAYIPGIVGFIEGIYYLTLSDERFAEKYG
jgi:pSer/pThr/pTyr-binding forkhead associated (FHA) protein